MMSSNSAQKKIDETYMRRALALARKASGETHPNPMVGAIVVSSDSAVVGSGYHRRAGEPHAEVVALQEARSLARGSTLYVSLEPCTHWGKTPPCVEQIISAGITRVVVAVRDPNPKVKGGGLEQLQAAGIAVTVGVLESEAREINIGWFHWVTTGRPFVTLKVACSIDGKIASAANESKWITSSIARAHVHRLRRHSDAVLVGAGTVIADNPRLSNRSGRGKQPLRLVVDSSLRVPADLNIFRPLGLDQVGPSPVVIAFTTSKSSFAKRRELELGGAEVVVLEDTKGRVDLEAMLEFLGERGVQMLLCEGGGELATSLLNAGLVQRLLVYTAPVLIGALGRSFFEERTIASLMAAPRLSLLSTRRVGRDVLSVYEPQRRN